ncbi:MAG: PQQ-binding-like beta-propeller repeat protein [Thermoplasmata archaeon]
MVSGDVSGDGKAEVVFGTDSGLLYVISGPDGSLMWKHQLPGSGAYAYLVDVALGRLDILVNFDLEEGVKSLCLISYPERITVWCYDLPGLLTAPMEVVLPNGKTGIFVGFADFSTGESGILALDLDGVPRWKVLTGWSPISMALGNIDGDLGDEVIATTQGRAIALKLGGDGQPWTLLWSLDLPGDSPLVTHVADLGGDDRPEVVLGAIPTAEIPRFEISVLAGDTGIPLWTRYISDLFFSPAIGDVDGDGKGEAVLLSTSGNLSVLDGSDGGELWTSTIEQPTSSPILLNLEGDEVLDIIVGIEGAVQAIRGSNGEKLWDISYGAGVSYVAAADLDGDGWDEILGVAGGTLFAIDERPPDILFMALLVGAGVGSSAMVAILLWRRFQKK